MKEKENRPSVAELEAKVLAGETVDETEFIEARARESAKSRMKELAGQRTENQRRESELAAKRVRARELKSQLDGLRQYQSKLAEIRTAVVDTGRDLYETKIGFVSQFNTAYGIAVALGLRQDPRSIHTFKEEMLRQGIPSELLELLFAHPDEGLPFSQFGLAFKELEENHRFGPSESRAPNPRFWVGSTHSIPQESSSWIDRGGEQVIRESGPILPS